MNNITLIHPFEVSKDKEDKFLSIWKNVDNYIKKQPGFIETKLHKSIENALTHKNTIYNFVNIAYWKSPEDFQNAIKTSEFQALAKDIFIFSRHPGIYEIIEE